MPDEDKPEGTEEAEASGGKGGLVPLLATGLVALGIGAGVGYVAFKPSPEMLEAVEAQAAVAEEAAGQQAEQEDAAAESADFQERLFELDPFIVNLTGDGYTRFVKVKVELETSKPEARAELESRLAQVRDVPVDPVLGAAQPPPDEVDDRDRVGRSVHRGLAASLVTCR